MLLTVVHHLYTYQRTSSMFFRSFSIASNKILEGTDPIHISDRITSPGVLLPTRFMHISRKPLTCRLTTLSFSIFKSQSNLTNY